MQERGRPVSQTARMRFDYRLRGYRLLAARIPEIQAHARLKPPHRHRCRAPRHRCKVGRLPRCSRRGWELTTLSMGTPPRVTWAERSSVVPSTSILKCLRIETRWMTSCDPGWHCSNAVQTT